MYADRAEYNRRGEEILASHRSEAGERWDTVLLPCDLRGIALSLRKTFNALFSSGVTGMIPTTLSLRFHSCWATFRECLRRLIRARPVIKEGSPAADRKGYKEKMLSHCLDLSTASGMQSATRLLAIANGDWERTNIVEHYRSPDLPAGMPDRRLATQVAD